MFKRIWNDPVVSGVIASLIGAALISWWTQKRYDWLAYVLRVFRYSSDFLTAKSGIPHWLIFLLALVACCVLVAVLVGVAVDVAVGEAVAVGVAVGVGPGPQGANAPSVTV